MSNLKESLGELVIAVSKLALSQTYQCLVLGLVMYKFWYWFVLPVFVNWVHISYGQAVGLSFMTVLFRNFDTTDKSLGDVKIEAKRNVQLDIVIPWFVLLIGWTLHILN